MCHSGCRWAGGRVSQWVPMGRGEEEQQGSLGEHFGRGAQKSCGRQLEKLGLSVQPSPLQSCGGQGGGPLGQREGRPASGGWKTKDSVRKVPCPVNRRGYSHLTYTRRYCAWFNFSSVRESWEIGPDQGRGRRGRCVPCVWSGVRAGAVCVVLQGLAAALGQAWLPELRFTALWLLPGQGKKARRTEEPLSARSRCWWPRGWDAGKGRPEFGGRSRGGGNSRWHG